MSWWHVPARNQVSLQENFVCNNQISGIWFLDRSLDDRCGFCEQKPYSELLERLSNGGLLKNNRQMVVKMQWPSNRQLFRVIGSMNNLETLSLFEWNLTLTEDVPELFRSCPKLTRLRLKLVESQKLKMNEELKNKLRSGFQRLKIFELKWDINSWPLI